ncbi:fluoride efflux transporter CrcB [Paenibacillus dendritiformis]|uniref:fluoride efflux transporter CrcB n=1 Tax=Paenibacillus dendritiformis TaxID=130049 RepID=UPI0036584FE6
MNMLWVAIGGALGAWSRYELGAYIAKRAGSRFPWGTLLVNWGGCFLLGLLAGMRQVLPAPLYIFAAVGWCGAFTTFSTFSFEALTLWKDKQRGRCALYLFLTAAVGLAAAAGGQWLAGLPG